MWAKTNIVINPKVVTLCRCPYYNHPKGCPNWDKKKGCPPKTQLLTKQEGYVIYNKFDFAAHIKRMKETHPTWTQRQLECCLYWQSKARKQLKDEVVKFKKEYPEYEIIQSPEAQGVDLTSTMKNISIDLEWPPKQYTYQIVLGIK